LDKGFDETSKIIEIIIFQSEKVRSETKDAKSLLQELVQQHLTVTPLYNIQDESGKDHQKVFTIEATVQ
jgi:ribonuclease-3